MAISKTVQQLVEVFAVDQKLSILKARRHKLLEQPGKIQELLKTAEKKKKIADDAFTSVGTKQKELERKLKVESQQIAARKENLSSLGSYKLQEAALKEINHNEHELKTLEDSLLSLMEQNEINSRAVAENTAAADKIRSELDDVKSSLEDELDSIAGEEEQLRSKRSSLTPEIDKVALAEYEKIFERLAPDVFCSVENGQCSECYIQVAPKLLGEIISSSGVTRCRGCSRIFREIIK